MSREGSPLEADACEVGRNSGVQPPSKRGAREEPSQRSFGAKPSKLAGNSPDCSLSDRAESGSLSKGGLAKGGLVGVEAW